MKHQTLITQSSGYTNAIKLLLPCAG